MTSTSNNRFPHTHMHWRLISDLPTKGRSLLLLPRTQKNSLYLGAILGPHLQATQKYISDFFPFFPRKKRSKLKSPSFFLRRFNFGLGIFFFTLAQPPPKFRFGFFRFLWRFNFGYLALKTDGKRRRGGWFFPLVLPPTAVSQKNMADRWNETRRSNKALPGKSPNL